MIEFTPAELAALLHEATEPLRRELASALDHATAEHKRATSLQRKGTTSMGSRTRSSISWAWDDAEKHVSELTAELNDTRAEVGDAQAEREAAFLDRKNLSQQLDAATKRAVQAEEALVGVQALNTEYRGRITVQTNRIAELEEALAAEKAAHAPQVGGSIDLEFGDWVQDSSGEFCQVYLNDEKLEQTDVCVVRGTGPDARIIWVAGGDS